AAPTPPPPPQGEKQLERLLSYTIFHIGMYATLFTAIVGYIKLAGDKQPKWVLVLLGLGSVPLLIAGAAGGIIAGHLAHFQDYKTFTEARLLPRLLERLGFKKGWKYDVWSDVEHTSFWVGVALIVVGLALSI